MTTASTGTGSGPRTRPWPWRWLAGRTLRGRLIAGLLVLLATACAAVGLVTSVALHNSLLNQLDQQLVSASIRYQFCVNHPPPGDGDQPGQSVTLNSAEDCAQMQGSQTFSAQVSNGTVTEPYVASTVDSHCTLSAADKEVLTSLPVGQGGYSSELSTLGDYRLLAVPGPGGVTYVTGLPLTQVNETMRQVLVVEALLFASVLLLSGVLGTGFVRLSLRPLRRVAATAARVTELPLASGEVTLPERVPDADPRTEVGQVGSAFNRMLGHVESALARRAASESRLRRFAADASHELRTPLAAIRGYAELARRHPGPIPPDIAHALSRVESESARMTVLVDELLLLAQLDAGRPLASEPVDLTRLAIDTSSDARAASGDHRWLLELPDEPVQVLGDEHRLHQVLANLMSNAAKHTPPGTTVTVAVATIENPGAVATNGNAAAVATNGNPGAVRLSVTDDGPGIPQDLQPALFERFVRGDSARSNAGASTGLGLAIVKAVTTAHGGSVSVASRPGQTSFVITLPHLAPPQPA
jgi:two-component system OmpR family sensor kinase